MTAADMEAVKQLVLKYGGVTKAKALAENSYKSARSDFAASSLAKTRLARKVDQTPFEEN